MVQVGARIEDRTLKVVAAGGVSDQPLSGILKGKKIVLVGVPGAFTGTCTSSHLPGYVVRIDDIKAKGVDKVLFVSVNDHCVMEAWARQANALDHIDFVADWNHALVDSLGLSIDLSAAGLGTRATRFSLIVDDGIVKAVNVEENPGEVSNSGAEALLEQL